MTHRVDAALEAEELPVCDADLDRAGGEPELEELPPADHAVLAPGKLGERPVRARL